MLPRRAEAETELERMRRIRTCEDQALSYAADLVVTLSKLARDEDVQHLYKLAMALEKALELELVGLPVGSAGGANDS